MNIAIPLGGQIRMVICSSFVIAKRKDATHYDLSGESFQLTGVTADQVYVFDDSVVITEGMELTHVRLRGKKRCFHHHTRRSGCRSAHLPHVPGRNGKRENHENADC